MSVTDSVFTYSNDRHRTNVLTKTMKAHKLQGQFINEKHGMMKWKEGVNTESITLLSNEETQLPELS